MTPSNLGWIAPEFRTPQMVELDLTVKGKMPIFSIDGNYKEPVDALLYKFIQDFKPFYQQTGSCVGCGLGMALWCLESVEVHQLAQLENPTVPFWLLPYGKSRELAGMNGRGEGSFGSAGIEALQKFGTLPANTKDLPQPQVKDNAFTWGENSEMEWSDGAGIKQHWLLASRKFTIQTAARIKTWEDGKASLINGYPMTCASNWGGMMDPPIKGNPAIILNKRVTQWGHQMCCLAWAYHPEFKDIFWIQNSWGCSHGTSPGNYQEPAGGFWILAKDFEWICKDGEVFSLSNFAGFPVQKLDWFI